MVQTCFSWWGLLNRMEEKEVSKISRDCLKKQNKTKKNYHFKTIKSLKGLTNNYFLVT